MLRSCFVANIERIGKSHERFDPFFLKQRFKIKLSSLEYRSLEVRNLWGTPMSISGLPSDEIMNHGAAKIPKRLNMIKILLTPTDLRNRDRKKASRFTAELLKRGLLFR